MRFLCIGAGAVGLYAGASLATAGHQVVFLARPSLEKKEGPQEVCIRFPGHGNLYANLPFTYSAEEALTGGPYAAAIMAVKSYDTATAAERLAAHASSAQALPCILCLQNGVENEAVLSDFFGSENVIAGTLTSAIARPGEYEVIVERERGLGIAKIHPLAATLAHAFNQASIRTRLYVSAEAMKWSKLLTNLLANATCAILDMAPSEVLAHPGLYRLELAQLREALRVMSAQGIQPVDLPGIPVRILAWTWRFLPPQSSRLLLSRAIAGGRGSKMPSLHIDLHAGKHHSEVEYLNGAVVRAGEKLHIPTPTNALLSKTLSAMASGEISPTAFARQPQRLLQWWVY